jgi:hypothetical protein
MKTDEVFALLGVVALIAFAALLTRLIRGPTPRPELPSQDFGTELGERSTVLFGDREKGHVKPHESEEPDGKPEGATKKKLRSMLEWLRFLIVFAMLTGCVQFIVYFGAAMLGVPISGKESSINLLALLFSYQVAKRKIFHRPPARRGALMRATPTPEPPSNDDESVRAARAAESFLLAERERVQKIAAGASTASKFAVPPGTKDAFGVPFGVHRQRGGRPMTPEEEAALGAEAISKVDEYYQQAAERLRARTRSKVTPEIAARTGETPANNLSAEASAAPVAPDKPTRATPFPKPIQPGVMSDWQRRLLLGVGAIVVLTMLFPPFSVPLGRGQFFTRFGFEFGGGPPGSINAGILLAEWTGIGILAAICWVLLSDRDKRRLAERSNGTVVRPDDREEPSNP